MTLLVTRCNIVDGVWETIDEPEHGDELAGVEVCRHELWGSPFVVALGVQVLSRLRSEDVYCSGEDVDVLEQDVQLILVHLPGIAAATGYEEAYIAHRAGNILRAVRWAKEHNGGVIVW